MSEKLTSLERVKKVFTRAKTLHCGVSELEWDDVREVLDDIESLEAEVAESDVMEKRLVDELEYLQSKLASTKARLAGYEVGYDPATNPPADNELVVADSRTFGWRLVVYSHELFYEGIGGVSFGVRECARWFPLPGAAFSELAKGAE